MLRHQILTAAILACAMTACDRPSDARSDAASSEIAQIEDPCGGPPGPAERSEAWLHAEMIRLGHDRSLVCRAPGEGLPPPETGGGIDSLKAEMARGDRIAAALQDESRLTGIMIDRQSEAVAAAR